jgi:hypothetical protein
MTTPTITLYPDTLPAKGQANAAFDTNVDNFLTWQTVTNGPELAAMITWTQGVADTVLATALAGNLPALTGKALNFIRANAAENGGEFRTPAQVLADIGALSTSGGIITGNVDLIRATGDAFLTVKTNGTGDADATLVLDSADTGESEIQFQRGGVTGARITYEVDDGLQFDGPIFVKITASGLEVENKLAIPATMGAAGTSLVVNAAGTAMEYAAYACRAWVKFNATGAIQAGGNVSSVTDNGTGDYTVNFATAMEDDDFAAIGQSGTDSNFMVVTATTTSSVRFDNLSRGTSQNDVTNGYVAIFR